MRRTRFMSWVFLVLSLAFFMVPDFRYALEAPLANYWWESQFSMPVFLAGGPKHSRLENLYTLKRYVSTEKLLALAEEANQKGDSEFVAFAALNLPEGESRIDGMRLADAAVRADSRLAWIYYFLDQWSLTKEDRQDLSEATFKPLRDRAERLVAFDPDNAVPHLLAAELIQARRGKSWPEYKKSPTDPEYLSALFQEADWRKEMDAAFSAQRYDSYFNQRFDLLRRVLRQRHWDHPAVVVTLCETAAIPNLLRIRSYANLQVMKIGGEAAAKGRLNDTIETDRRVEEFADRMRLQAPTLIERLIAVACQQIAHQGMIPVLKKAGRKSEADLLEYTDRQTKEDLQHNRFLYSGSTHNDWSVLLVCISAGLVIAFSIATFVLVLYVNANLWFRKDRKGRIFDFMTTAENYAPILLAVSCLSLYLNNAPFAFDFAAYMASSKPYSSFPPGFYSSMYPSLSLVGESNFPATITFMDYIPYALGGLALLTFIMAVSHLRSARSRSSG